MGFGYYSPLLINAAQVPSPQVDFPVLVSQTDARFKTVGNGGHVQNSSGFDIRPYLDTGLTVPVAGYELVFYDGVNGIIEMWVKVGSLSSSTTPFYLAYGDATISTDGSSTTTWSNNFLAVYHLKDGTTLNVNDSTANANNGTNGLTTHAVTATTGQIDGGGAFASASTQAIGVPSLNAPAVTISAWVKGTTFPSDYNSVINMGAASVDQWGIFVKSTGKLYYTLATTGTPVSQDGTGSHTLTTGTWFYLTATYASGLGFVGYVNAASDVTQAATGTSSGSTAGSIGSQRSTNTRFWNGSMDELRVCSAARSANWITTEYNNQFTPGTFETLGTEVNFIPISGLFRL